VHIGLRWKCILKHKQGGRKVQRKCRGLWWVALYLLGGGGDLYIGGGFGMGGLEGLYLGELGEPFWCQGGGRITAGRRAEEGWVFGGGVGGGE